jgi:hypothetical protein
MANANLPRGLIPVRFRSGAVYNGSFNIYYVPASYATALYIGDPVIGITNQSDANGIPVVNRAAAGGGTFILGAMLGVVGGGEPVIPTLAYNPTYRPASVAAYIAVADDPDVLFEVQENSSVGNIGIGGSGRNVDLVAGSGTGANYSGFQLASNTLNTTNTLQMRLVRPAERINNNPTATDSLAKWWAFINLHSARNLTGI